MPAAIVLYKPVAKVLACLLDCLREEARAVFMFCNGAIDDETEALLATLEPSRIVRCPQNVGLGAGLNELAHKARAEGFSHIQFFDQDSSPTPGAAADLLSRFLALDGRPLPIAVVAPRLVAPEGEKYLNIRYEPHSVPGQALPGAVRFAPTSGSVISMDALDKVGMFRADFFIDSIDVEWCMRAWHNGYACIVADDVAMGHRWGNKISRDRKVGLQILLQDPVRNFYYIRNTTHCVSLNHYPVQQKVRLLARLAAQITVLLISNWKDPLIWRLVTTGLRAGLFGPMGPAPKMLPAGKSKP